MSHKCSIWLALVALATCLASAVSADRLVLAPRGRILSPGEAEVEFAVPTSAPWQYTTWLNLGVPVQDLGLEFEYRHTMSSGRANDTFGIQYSVIGEAFTNNIAPSIAVGLRDINNRAEGRSLYLAMTKSLALSQAQERLLKSVRLTGGAGTGGINGLFGGVEITLSGGLHLAVESLAGKLNTGLRLPVAPQLEIRASTFDGEAMVGLAAKLMK